MRAVGAAAALAVLLGYPAPSDAAMPPCPGTATVAVYALNLGPDPAITLPLDGDLVSTATCAGPGLRHYAVTLSCTGTGLVRCGTLSGLAPGVWLDRRSAPAQTRRDVFLADAPGVANTLTWTLYPHTYQVTTTDPADIRARLREAEASGGPALITFALPSGSTIAFGQPDPACPPGASALLCLLGPAIVLDGLDASGNPAVTLSAGNLHYRLVRVFGQDDVLRGLVLRGAQFAVPFDCRPDVTGPGCPTQADTLDFAPGSQRGWLDQTIVFGPARGDAVSVEGTDVIVAASEITGADDKGLKATDGGSVTIRDSCVHDNANGGVQSTRGAHVTALRNIVEHNLPREAENGLLVIEKYPELSTSALVTDGNVVRFNGNRGLSVSGDARGVFANDFVADNGAAGAVVESLDANPAGKPAGVFRGVTLACNHRDRLTGTCAALNPPLACTPTCTNNGCTDDAHCCAMPGCGVACSPSFPDGFGAVVNQCTSTGCALPSADFGNAADPGGNAFAQNPNTFASQTGFNLKNAVAGLAVPARGDQWQQGATVAPCGTMAPVNPDVCIVPGATVDTGGATDPRAGAPVLTSVVPARPRAGDLVRVYGAGFDAIHGVACAQAGQTGPTSTCTGENPKVAAANATSPFGNRVTVTLGGQPFAADVWAVTPTMLAFRMPVDCFAVGTVTVARQDATGAVRTASIALCQPQSCAGETSATPCDDGNACTVGDHCSGIDDTCVPGPPATCAGPCMTGVCDPTRGCLPASASTPCDDGDPCSVGDHCRGDAPVCMAGPACATEGLCLTAPCDAARTCTLAAAVACEAVAIGEAVRAAGGGGRTGTRIVRLAARVQADVGAAFGANRRRGRRLLTRADGELGRLLALLRDTRLPASLAVDIRGAARTTRHMIRAARRAL